MPRRLGSIAPRVANASVTSTTLPSKSLLCVIYYTLKGEGHQDLAELELMGESAMSFFVCLFVFQRGKMAATKRLVAI